MGIERDEIIGQLLAVFQEACHGPQQKWSYFTDSDSNSALFATLDAISATDASRSIGGTSIANQAYHLVFSAKAVKRWISGDHGPNDWSQSWGTAVVDDPAWDHLRSDLRASHDELAVAIKKHTLDSTPAFGGVLGLLSHLAYHLGAIRQKVAVLKSG